MGEAQGLRRSPRAMPSRGGAGPASRGPGPALAGVVDDSSGAGVWRRPGRPPAAASAGPLERRLRVLRRRCSWLGVVERRAPQCWCQVLHGRPLLRSRRLPLLAAGKVHGSLARAGKVRGQTPKVPKQEKKKQVRRVG